MTDRLHDPTPTPLPLPEDLGRTADGTPAMPEAEVLKAASKLVRLVPSDALVELIGEVFGPAIAQSVNGRMMKRWKALDMHIPLEKVLHLVDDALLASDRPISTAWTQQLANALSGGRIETLVEIVNDNGTR